MLRVTAFCPTDQAEAVIALLREEPQVRKVIRMPGVHVSDGGDVVMAFLPSEASAAVLERLRALRHWEPGDLSFINVDLFMGHDGVVDTAGDDEGEAEGTIGQEMILARSHKEARLSWRYLTFMACAGVIAAVGLVHNQPPLLMGAMAISPDLAPVNAIAVALTACAVHQTWRAIRTLLLGLGFVMVVSFVATLVFQATGMVDSGVRAVDELLTAFVTVVGLFSVIVALASGVAAMVAFLTEQARTAVGVAISVTTIPAAAYVGVALASGAFVSALAALSVLTANVVLVLLAQSVTLVLIRAWRARSLRRRAEAG